MADGNYDNTNSGVIFQPWEDQKLVGQGNLDIEGKNERLVMVVERLKKGGPPTKVLYKRMGVLFPNDKNGNEKAPDFSGPLDDHPSHRVAGWKGTKDGKHYISLKASQREQQDGGNGQQTSGGGGFDGDGGFDEIPF